MERCGLVHHGLHCARGALVAEIPHVVVLFNGQILAEAEPELI